MKGFERLLYSVLGLGTQTVGDSLHVLTNGSRSAVTFLNAAFDEWIARSPSAPAATDGGEIEFRLSSGQSTKRSATLCIPTTDAYRALEEFVETGHRPSWLAYDSTKKGKQSR